MPKRGRSASESDPSGPRCRYRREHRLGKRVEQRKLGYLGRLDQLDGNPIDRLIEYLRRFAPPEGLGGVTLSAVEMVAVRDYTHACPAFHQRCSGGDVLLVDPGSGHKFARPSSDRVQWWAARDSNPDGSPHTPLKRASRFEVTK